MSLCQHYFYLDRNSDDSVQRQSTTIKLAKRKILFILLAFSLVFQLSGCVSDKVADQTAPAAHHKLLIDQGQQRQTNTEELDKRPLRRLKTSYYPSPPPSQLISGVATINDPNTDQKTVLASGDAHQGKKSTAIASAKRKILSALSAFSAMFELDSCVSDKVTEQNDLVSYQEFMTDQDPKRRADTEAHDPEQPLGLLKTIPSPSPVVSGVATVKDPNTDQKTVLASGDTYPGLPRSPTAGLPELKFVMDPNTGLKTVELTIEETVARMLANSLEIRVVSFDPSIVKQDITRAASEFDFTTFGRVNYEQEDVPPNSIFQPGQSDGRTYETGIKQMGVTGAEWSLSYGLTRSWDDLFGRTLSTRFEPILSFQLKQPLLRDAWQDVTLSGVNVAKLNYKIALLGFREKSEDIATQVISAYWGLVQARRDVEIHQELVDRTFETLNKVEGRREIDATDVQIKQTESYAKLRQAALIHTRKSVGDAQEILIRLMADTQLNVIDEFEIIPLSDMSLEARMHEPSKALEIAMRKNPLIQQARIGVEIADINFRVAENQKMPRLDLIASARTQGLHQDVDTSHDRLKSGDFVSYAVGLSLEYPLGNRQRQAELLRRRLEKRQAVVTLQNIADQVAIAAKEGLRRIKTNHLEIQIQKDAVKAAQIHLQTLKDTEPVREQLTPEFLLVKLQAQETLANAQRSENRAVVDFNIALIQLARTLGTVLELDQIKSGMPTIPDSDRRLE